MDLLQKSHKSAHFAEVGQLQSVRLTASLADSDAEDDDYDARQVGWGAVDSSAAAVAG